MSSHCGRLATAIAKFSFGNTDNLVDSSLKFTELEKALLPKVDNSLITSRRVRITKDNDHFRIFVPGKEDTLIVENQFVCHKVIDGIPYFNLFPELETITKDYNYANKGEYYENIQGKKINTHKSLETYRDGKIVKKCFMNGYNTMKKNFSKFIPRIGEKKELAERRPVPELSPTKKFKLFPTPAL